MPLLQKLSGYPIKSKDKQIKSIIDNLNNVLSTKRDYGFFLHNFGLSNIEHIQSRDNANDVLIKEISENIAQFEPRIILKKIIPINEGKIFSLSFLIDFELLNESHSFKLYLASSGSNAHD